MSGPRPDTLPQWLARWVAKQQDARALRRGAPGPVLESGHAAHQIDLEDLRQLQRAQPDALGTAGQRRVPTLPPSARAVIDALPAKMSDRMAASLRKSPTVDDFIAGGQDLIKRVAALAPGTGNLKAALDAASEAAHGHLASAGLTALGAIPFFGMEDRAGAGAVRALEGAAERGGINPGRFAILTAENPGGMAANDAVNQLRNDALVAELRDRGYDPVPVRGRYQDPSTNQVLSENSFLVPAMPEREAKLVAKRYGQNGIITHRGYHDLMQGLLYPSRGVEAASDVPYTELPTGKRIRLNIDFANGQKSPVQALPIAKNANPEAQRVAAQYLSDAGIQGNRLPAVAKVDEAAGRRMATAYDQLQSNPNDPAVQRAYAALSKEVGQQYQAIKDAGYNIQFVDQDPYKNSAEMMADVRNNHTLKVLKTNPSSAHPLLTPEQNDQFRAVHDFFGHAAEGNQFGPKGEENAFRAHSAMFSPLARRAMATETRGQNSWVNFFGDHPGMAATDRPFAQQKAALWPEGLMGEYGDAGALPPEPTGALPMPSAPTLAAPTLRHTGITLPEGAPEVLGGPTMPETPPSIAYHGTYKPGFSVPTRSEDLGPHIGTPDQASAFATTWGTPEGHRIMPLRDFTRNPAVVSTDPGTWAVPEDAAKTLAKDGIISHAEAQQIREAADNVTRRVREQLDAEEAQNGKMTTRVWTSRFSALSAQYNQEVKDQLRGMLTRRGYDSVLYPNRYEGAGKYIIGEQGRVPTIDDQEALSKIVLNPQRDLQNAFEPATLGAESPMTPLTPTRSASAMGDYLLPDEQQLLDKANGATLESAKNAFRKAPSADVLANAALAGQSKRGWYENSATALRAAFGNDAPRFAALVASLSPQTPVERNLEMALSMWKNWTEAGRPTDAKAIRRLLGNSVLGDMGEASVLPAWTPNTIRALTADTPEALMLSGPKVNAFRQNLSGDQYPVTLDTWMAKLADINQKRFDGRRLVSTGGVGVASGPYLGYSARIRQTADYLTRATGHLWTPAQVQETTWSWANALENASAGGGEGGLMDMVGRVSPEDIASVPDFATLLRSDPHASTLASMGLRTPAPSSGLPLVGDNPDVAALRKLAANIDRYNSGRYLLGAGLFGALGLGAEQNQN